MSERPKTRLVVSIDTEEDNWVPVRTGVSVENIREMPKLQRFLSSFGVRPTYFTTYAVAASPWAADVMRAIAEAGGTEIGGHLHPWNTPPLTEPFVPEHTMMKNLPPEVQLEKLRVLSAELTRAVGKPPVSFRAGRWGLGPESVPQLLECGYRVDSSVMPFVDWSSVDDGANYDGAPCTPYRLGAHDLRLPDPDGDMIELPVSSGYNRIPFSRWHAVYEKLTANGLRRFRFGGIARRLGFLQKIQLSPETENLRAMIALSQSVMASGIDFLHVFLHSPSLRAGLNPYGATSHKVDALYRKLGSYLEAMLNMADVEFATVTEVAEGALAPALSR